MASQHTQESNNHSSSGSSTQHDGSGSPGPQRPHVSMQKVDAHSPPETCLLLTQSGLAKAALTWPDLILKSFIGGVFISMGALFDLIIAGGAIGVRANNPSLATLMSGLVFPIGFAMLTVTNVELATSNMMVMVYTLLQRRTTVYDLGRNWVVSYLGNLAGCLFFAGFLTWWSDSLSTDAEKSYAASGAADRVNQDWGVNFLRGVGCNWLVAMAVFFATAAKDGVSKIYGIWIPVTAFCVMGYQHCIANFFLVPVGMFYGADVTVGKYIYQSVIPVTLGNILGGAVFGGFVFWWLYGRNETQAARTGQPLSGENENKKLPVTHSGETLDAGAPRHDAASDLTRRGGTRKGDEMV